MSDRPRFVFDANTVVSAALIKGSTPDRALRLARSNGRLLQSRDSILELQSVLARPKFDRYLTREERDTFLAKLIEHSELVDVAESVNVCRDPRDDKYLALALTGQATAIVTDGTDLHVLKSFEGIPILSSAEFLAHMSHQKG